MSFKSALSFILVSSFLYLVSCSPINAVDVSLKAKTLNQTDWSTNFEKDKALNSGDKFQIQLTVKNSSTAPETQIQVSSKLSKYVELNELGLFRIVEVQPGEEYVRIFTATLKKAFNNKEEIIFTAKAKDGKSVDSTLYVYTNVPTVAPTATVSAKVATSSAKLPSTGPAEIAFGTIVAACLALVAIKLRSIARGY